MNISLPSVADITALLAALEAHPVGAVLLLLLMLTGVLGLWVCRLGPVKKARGGTKTGTHL